MKTSKFQIGDLIYNKTTKKLSLITKKKFITIANFSRNEMKEMTGRPSGPLETFYYLCEGNAHYQQGLWINEIELEQLITSNRAVYKIYQ
jgi:hypothetical protein